MKKIVVLMLSVAFLLALGVGMVCAKPGAKNFPWNGPFDTTAVETCMLIEDTEVGEVFIRTDGTFKVEIKDAAVKEFGDDGETAINYTAEVFCGDQSLFSTSNAAKVEDGELIFFAAGVQELASLACPAEDLKVVITAGGEDFAESCAFEAEDDENGDE